MKKDNIKKCITILFILYCLVLIFLLVIPNHFRPGLNYRLFNIIPFHTIINYFINISDHTINTEIVIQNG